MFRFRDGGCIYVWYYNMCHTSVRTRQLRQRLERETRFRKNHNNYTHRDSINAALDGGGGGTTVAVAIHHRPSRDDRAAHVSHDEHAFHHRRIIPLTERILYVVISYPLPAAGRI